MAQLPAFAYVRDGVPYWAVAGSGGGGTSTFTTASISSLSVSSINGLEADQLDAAAWSFFPAQTDVDMNGFSLSNFSVLNGAPTVFFAADNAPIFQANQSTIGFTPDVGASKFFGSQVSTNQLYANSGTIRNLTTTNLTVISTIHVVSSISTTSMFVQELTNVSSINGLPLSSLGSPADWSLFPALSTLNMAGCNIGDINTPASLPYNIVASHEVAVVAQSTFPQADAIMSVLGQPGDNNFSQFGLRVFSNSGNDYENTSITQRPLGAGFQIQNSFVSSSINYVVGTLGINEATQGWYFTDMANNTYTMSNGQFVAPTMSTGVLNVSSINGIEFTGGGGGQVTLSTLTSQALSTVGASIVQGLMSSIVFNPQVNPTFNVDLGMGSFLTQLGTGLFAVAVGVPTTAGTITYGMVKGLASLFEPRPVNNINNTVFETFNYASQLQISTLNEQISTITRLVSTIPSTILVNSNPTFSTIDYCDVEILVSTLSPLPPFNAIRAIGDPTQIVSAPWNVYQATPDWSWVPLPSGGGAVSTMSTFSSIYVNGDIHLLPSTILKSEPATGGVLYVLEPDGTSMGQVAAQGLNIQNTYPGPTDGIYTGISGIPVWLDQNVSSFRFALQKQDVTFQNVNLNVPLASGVKESFNQQDANLSTLQSLTIEMLPTSGNPTLSYTVYPPGFPSTTFGQIIFNSTLQGGLGGVQINSQLGAAKSLAVSGDGVFTTDLITGSNSDYPLLVQTPDLDQWVLLGLSTMSGGGVGKTEILNTMTTNYGQLVIAAPNMNTNSSVRVLTLDSSNVACGVNNPNPVATLDVGLGLNYSSVGSIGAFAANRNGTLEVTLQNQNTGCNASAFFFAVENTGTDYAGFGQNSLNLSSIYDTFHELPGASVQSGTLDCVIGPQSDHSANSGIYLTYQDGSNAVLINSNGSVSFNASYAGAVVNQGNFGTPGSVLITNGGAAPPDWGNSINMNVIGASTLNANTINTSTAMTFGFADFQNRDILDVSVGGITYDVLNVDVSVSPADRVLNINVPGAADYIMTMRNTGSNVGIGKIPQDGVKLDVNGVIGGSNVSTNTLDANSATISSITQPIALDALPVAGACLAAGYNFDAYTSPYFGVFDGKQIVQGGYFGTTDASLPAGKGQFSFAYPVPLSSLMTFQATYFTNSTSPGLNSIPWVGNSTPDAFGRASTIQVYGDSGRDLFCYFLGIV